MIKTVYSTQELIYELRQSEAGDTLTLDEKNGTYIDIIIMDKRDTNNTGYVKILRA